MFELIDISIIPTGMCCLFKNTLAFTTNECIVPIMCYCSMHINCLYSLKNKPQTTKVPWKLTSCSVILLICHNKKANVCKEVFIIKINWILQNKVKAILLRCNMNLKTKNNRKELFNC